MSEDRVRRRGPSWLKLAAIGAIAVLLLLVWLYQMHVFTLPTT